MINVNLTAIPQKNNLRCLVFTISFNWSKWRPILRRGEPNYHPLDHSEHLARDINIEGKSAYRRTDYLRFL